ncbi:hypothetical protein NKH18_44305 [Streptomyces sp. M10(2022)]
MHSATLIGNRVLVTDGRESVHPVRVMLSTGAPTRPTRPRAGDCCCPG